MLAVAALSILLIGDSFTAMPAERPLPAVLREMGVRVESPGRPGDGPREYLMYARKLGKPDQARVLLFYEANDAQVPCNGPDTPGVGEDFGKMLRLLTPTGLKDALFVWRWKMADADGRRDLAGDLAPRFFLEPSWASRRGGYIGWRLPRERQYEWLRAGGGYARREAPPECAVRRSIELVRAARPDFVFFIPEAYRADGNFRDEIDAAYGRDMRGAFGLPDAVWDRIRREIGGVTLDTGPGSYAGDGHWSPGGVERAAQKIAETLAARRLHGRLSPAPRAQSR